MITPRRMLGALAIALGAALIGAAPIGAQVTDPIPSHDTLAISSRTLGEKRLINVHVPATYRASASTRFPVLYMPDGGLDEDFPHVVNTVDSLVALRAIQPVIVVGIPNTERRRDLTGPTRFAADSAIAKRVGGSAAFRLFLRDELIPVIRSRYRTTEDRGIVGESLAGLFVVETFLLEPTLFTRYIALDPRVQWNGGALVDSVPSLLKQFYSSPRIFFLSNGSDATEIAAGAAKLAGFLRAS